MCLTHQETVEFLKDALDACDHDAIKWIKKNKLTLKQAWAKCQHPLWMLEFLVSLDDQLGFTLKDYYPPAEELAFDLLYEGNNGFKDDFLNQELCKYIHKCVSIDDLEAMIIDIWNQYVKEWQEEQECEASIKIDYVNDSEYTLAG